MIKIRRRALRAPRGAPRRRGRAAAAGRKKQLLELTLVKHQGLVGKLARKYVRPGVDLRDLVQEGNLGLMAALRRHNPKKGALSTIAVPHIESRIRRAVQHAHGVRLPERVLQRHRGKVHQLAHTIGGLEDKLKSRKFAKKYAAHFSTSGGIPQAEARAQLHKLLTRTTLTSAERMVLGKRVDGHTLAHIAKHHLKTSVSTAHAIERKAFAKLRNASMRKRGKKK